VTAPGGIVDAWLQHPTTRMLGEDMFASLRRWTGGAIPDRFSGRPSWSATCAPTAATRSSSAPTTP
jgi:hypothetical protein